jgi:hypothetical protein
VLHGYRSLAVEAATAPVTGVVRDSLLRGLVTADGTAAGASVSLALTLTTVDVDG